MDKNIFILVIIIMTTSFAFAKDSYLQIDSKITTYRVDPGGFWFAFEKKPYDVNAGHHRMHAYITIDNNNYNTLVSIILLAISTDTPIKSIFYNDELQKSGVDALKIYALEMD